MHGTKAPTSEFALKLDCPLPGGLRSAGRVHAADTNAAVTEPVLQHLPPVEKNCFLSLLPIHADSFF